MTTRDAPPLDPVPADLRELWDYALRDVGFTRADVELQLFDGDPTAPKPQWGMHLAPGDTTHDLDDHFTEAQRDAVDKLNMYKHRVVVWLGEPRLPGKIIQALMRHELRHAEQVDHNHWVYRIGMMTEASLGRVYAGKGDGSASVRRLIPHEADANAAAKELVAPVGNAARARDGNFRPLVSETQPLRPLETLGRRTLAFAALHPDAFVARARALVGSERLVLEALDPDGPALFAKLVADDELTALRDHVAAAFPSADAIAAAGAPARAASRRPRDSRSRESRWARTRAASRSRSRSPTPVTTCTCSAPPGSASRRCLPASRSPTWPPVAAPSSSIRRATWSRTCSRASRTDSSSGSICSTRSIPPRPA
jgi:hypothetical protein